MTTPTIPATLRAGDTFTATWSLADYPATAGWVARLTLINSAQHYPVTASASGADHALTAAASDTAAWAPGSYSWSIDVTKAAERHTVATGRTEVLPDLADATTYDTRSAARKALEAAEGALATYGAQAYLKVQQFGDRRQEFATPGEFLAFVDKLRAQVRAEDNAERLRQGLRPRNRLLVRFTR